MDLYSVELDLDGALDAARACPSCGRPMARDRMTAGGYRCGGCGRRWRVVLGEVCPHGPAADAIPAQRSRE